MLHIWDCLWLMIYNDVVGNISLLIIHVISAIRKIKRKDNSLWKYNKVTLNIISIKITPNSFFPPHLLTPERQRCALWIKKLCDPAMSGSGLTGHKNRNMYARLLLHMLRRGVLEGPFTSKPEAGSLKTLPTYMVNMTVYQIVNCQIKYYIKTTIHCF